MDIESRIERAHTWHVAGRSRAALDSLRQLVRDVPQSTRARLALAELYRDLGHAEQAGRWSALTPEWATDRERRAFAVFLQQWSVDPYRVLLLPRYDNLPRLPRPPRRPSVIRRFASSIDTQHAAMVGPEWVRQPALGLWVAGWAVVSMAFVVLVVMMLTAWAIASRDAAESVLARDVGLAITSVGVLVGAALLLPSELLARNWPQVCTLIFISVGSGFAFVALGLPALFSSA
jgi:hypothetical protein